MLPFLRAAYIHPLVILSLVILSILSMNVKAVNMVASRLYFRHGAVSSAKTLNLLAVAHTYRVQGKCVIVMKVRNLCVGLLLLLYHCNDYVDNVSFHVSMCNSLQSTLALERET